MKKVTRIIIRIIGGVMLLVAVALGVNACKDSVFNGLDVAVIFLASVGAYLTLASEESILSWKLPLEKNYDEEDDE